MEIDEVKLKEELRRVKSFMMRYNWLGKDGGSVMRLMLTTETGAVTVKSPKRYHRYLNRVGKRMPRKKRRM